MKKITDKFIYNEFQYLFIVIFKYLRKIKYKIEYFIEDFSFLKTYFSPFKTIKIKLYFGKIAIGLPYFYPRKLIKSKTKPGYFDFKNINWFGFNYCSLGWKTKWTNSDYRFEWSPIISIILFKKQFAIIFRAEYYYWEAWLYYKNNTDKSKSEKERIIQCMKEFSLKYTVTEKGNSKKVNYYNNILKDKYLKYVEQVDTIENNQTD